MHGDNPSSADDQQERPGFAEWIVGFVDGSHREDMVHYQVTRRSDLIEVIIPFFEDHPLITAKRRDFELFARIVRSMQQGQHLTERGMAGIARMTEQMNRRVPSRFLESSETGRRPSPTTRR